MTTVTTDHLSPGAAIRAATLAAERRYLAAREGALDDACASGECRHPACGGARRAIAATRQRVEDIDHGAAFATVVDSATAGVIGVHAGAWSVSDRNEAELLGVAA